MADAPFEIELPELSVEFVQDPIPEPAVETAEPPPEGVNQDAEPRAVCLAPDVCLTPVGSMLVPVPYQVYGKAEDAQNFSTSVYFRGTPAMRFNSVFSKTYGDEPAQDKGGVKSGARGGKVEPTGHSPAVNIQGSPAMRHGDRVTLNDGNTPGEIVLSRDRSTSAPPNTYMANTSPAQPEGAADPPPNTYMANTAPAQPDAPGAGAAGSLAPGADVDWWSGSLATDQSAEASAEVWRKGKGAAAEWATGHPRTMGAIQAAGAVAEAGGAAALVVGGTAAEAKGVGAPVGAALQALGWAGLMNAADNFQADLRQMWYGKPQETLGRRAAGALAQAAGASPATVEQIKAFTGAAQTVVGGVAGMGGLARLPAGAAVASRAAAAAGTGKRSAEGGLRVTGKGGKGRVVSNHPLMSSMNSSNSGMSIEKSTSNLLRKIGERRTVVIARRGSEEMRYLDMIGAEANVGGADFKHILLRENPGKAAVLEEFLHGTQQKLGIIDRLGTHGYGSAETHVKNFMIRHQKILGLADEDVSLLKKLRDEGL